MSVVSTVAADAERVTFGIERLSRVFVTELISFTDPGRGQRPFVSGWLTRRNWLSGRAPDTNRRGATDALERDVRVGMYDEMTKSDTATFSSAVDV